MNRIAAVVAGLSLAFIATSEAIADILNVPADYPTIVAAVNAASNGDEIHIDAGTYYESGIDLQGKAIVIKGKVTSGTLNTTIDGQNQGSIFTMNSGEGHDTEIRDLRLINGGQDKWTFGVGYSVLKQVRGSKALKSRTAQFCSMAAACSCTNPMR